MISVAVWEGNDGLFDDLAQSLGDKVHLVRGEHPAHLMGRVWELLVIAPGAKGWAGGRLLTAKRALLPGRVAGLGCGVQADSAVSYGTGAQDTLTFSSLNEGAMSLALQRELVTVGGDVLERQELVLPYHNQADPLIFLCRAGVLLLLGQPVGGVF